LGGETRGNYRTRKSLRKVPPRRSKGEAPFRRRKKRVREKQKIIRKVTSYCTITRKKTS